jgi:hypothetical protein
MSDDSDGGETKTYEAYLLINWSKDDLRVRKTHPGGKLGPQELAIPISVDVTVPEVQVPEIHADITVPPAKVEQAVTGGVDDEAMLE